MLQRLASKPISFACVAPSLESAVYLDDFSYIAPSYTYSINELKCPALPVILGNPAATTDGVSPPCNQKRICGIKVMFGGWTVDDAPYI